MNKYINKLFAQKWEYNYYKSLVVRLTHCERHGYPLPCIKYCFHGPDKKILIDAGREKACLIFKGEHGIQKVANLCKFGKYYSWPAQDWLNWSDHCHLLFSHENMLWRNHCKSVLWLNASAKMWITFNAQNTSKSWWKSNSFFFHPEKVFLPVHLGKCLWLYNFRSLDFKLMSLLQLSITCTFL